MSRPVRMLLFALGVAACAAFYAWVSLDPAIHIRNQSGKRLTNVSCILSTGDSPWTEKLGDLEDGQSSRISRSVADLFIQSIEYQWGEASVVWRNGGIATTGESLDLVVGPDGTISTSHRTLW